MTAEALSQEEIDALLREQGAGGGTAGEEAGLAAEEREVVSQYVELFQSASKEIWPQLTGGIAFEIKLEKIESLNSESLPEQSPDQVIVMSSSHDKDIQGKIACILDEPTGRSIARSMMGEAEEFGELEQSAVGEGQSQTFGMVCTQLTNQMKVNTNVSPWEFSTHAKESDDYKAQLQALGERVVCAFFNMTVGEATGVCLLIFSNEVIDGLMKAVVQPEAQPQAQPAPAGGPSPGTAAAGGAAGESVRPAMFDSFTESPSPGRPGNLDLILDIGLGVQVELGRTSMRIKDILDLGPGAVIELDKLAGEPVELLINDKLFARGEVVVIDENFGVRLTDIITVKERIEAMGK
jgi:flagellar motor switch protein FliN